MSITCTEKYSRRRPSDSLESSGAILRPRSPCQPVAHLSIYLTNPLCLSFYPKKLKGKSFSSSFKEFKSCSILRPRSACQAHLPVRLRLCSFLPIPSVQLLVSWAVRVRDLADLPAAANVALPKNETQFSAGGRPARCGHPTWPWPGAVGLAYPAAGGRCTCFPRLSLFVPRPPRHRAPGLFISHFRRLTAEPVMGKR